MPTRRKPAVRLRKYDRADQITVVDFLIDRFQAIDHSLERCREMLKLEANEYTIAQTRFYEHSQSNMLWLLNTLSVYRNTATDKLTRVRLDKLLKEVKKQQHSKG